MGLSERSYHLIRWNKSTQYKILKDALPVYCAKKLYLGVGKIVCNMQDWDEATFYEPPPDDTLKRTFSTPYNTLLCMRRLANGTDVPELGDMWVVFDKNLQKIEMGKYKQKVWEQEKQ